MKNFLNISTMPYVGAGNTVERTYGIFIDEVWPRIFPLWTKKPWLDYLVSTCW